MMDTRIVEKLQDARQRLSVAGKLYALDRIETYISRFRARFGPEALRRLDGLDLLLTMHGGIDNDALNYWLEFKDDDELPDIFGRIFGGSALKFGLYLQKKTGLWKTGAARKQEDLTEDQAIEIARRQRDQLCRIAQRLEELSVDGDKRQYEAMQQTIDADAPDVADMAWVHKYFSMLYSDRVDWFHTRPWQDYYLIKLLLTPPAMAGRFVPAGDFLEVSRETNIPMIHLGPVLMEAFGYPIRYWRIGTYDMKGGYDAWPSMRTKGRVSVGWSAIGDLSALAGEDCRDRLKELLIENERPDYAPTAVGKAASELQNFLTTIEEGHIVVAMAGAKMRGVGRVSGGYGYDPDEPFPHYRPVEWLSFEEGNLPETEGLLSTVRELRKHPANLIDIERRILDGDLTSSTPARHVPEVVAPPPLTGIPARIDAILERKGQVILYGPPGTGKTYWAMRTLRELAARHHFRRTYEALTDQERARIDGGESIDSPYVRVCCFHPAYGYEDFIEGYRPHATNGSMTFERQDGVFRKLCRDAAADTTGRYYLLIDEINRGDIPRIFGELLMVLEKDKRNTPILLPLSREPFVVPSNVYIVGTMNTADRSIALLDTALRRRFGFIELMPDSAVLGQAEVRGIPLGLWLDALNGRIRSHAGRDARNLQIGHAFFLDSTGPITSFTRFVRVLREDILPLVQEYCYEDFEALERIFSRTLVDARQQRIREELFETAGHDELISLLVSMDETLAGAAVTVEAAAEPPAEDELGDEESADEAETA